MKILFVSMNSIHFRRWSDQLRDSGHEVYWFDVKDQGYAPSMSWMTQITGWKKGFLKKRGRTFIKNKFPLFYNILVRKFDHPIEDAFAKALQEIEPDIVHSFALYLSCTPILPVMSQNSIPWLYSSWGSDLFYYRNEPEHLKDIQAVLPRVNYMFTDCGRDQNIADELGFTGEYLGIFPGGGGFDLELFEKYKTPFQDRKIIAVKGNQNRSGRAIPVLKALEQIILKLKDFEVVVFGVENPDVFKFQKSKIPNITIQGLLSHEQLIALLCKSVIYIGNSNSDGMPNTLLEAICAGVFPIQSNPGGATTELIENGVNGLLIEECENIEHLQEIVETAISNYKLMDSAIKFNTLNIVPLLSERVIRENVLLSYESIIKELND